MIPTADPYIVIEEERPAYTRYRRSDGRRWEQYGECVWEDPTRWGPCGEGSQDPPPGPPQRRLDIPNAPGLRCALCVDGGYIWFREL